MTDARTYEVGLTLTLLQKCGNHDIDSNQSNEFLYRGATIRREV
jgi:hypothetical protein